MLSVDELIVADDETWSDRFGETPVRPVSVDDEVRELIVPAGDGDRLVHLSWDQTDRSVRVRIRRGDRVEIDVYRELASLVTVVGEQVVVEYGHDGYAGRLVLTLGERFSLKDSSLRA